MPARRGVAPPDRARGYGWLMGLRRYMGSGGRACVEPPIPGALRLLQIARGIGRGPKLMRSRARSDVAAGIGGRHPAGIHAASRAAYHCATESRFAAICGIFLTVAFAGIPQAAGAAAPGAPGERSVECAAPRAREACEAEALRQAEQALEAARRGATEAIAATDGPLDPEEREAWARAFTTSLSLWRAFRDARCDPRLISYEGARKGTGPFADAPGCRVAITRVMAGDVSFRYDLEVAAHPRESATRASPARAEGAEAKDPCGDVDPAACDYCGANQCWEQRLARVDRELNRVWVSSLGAIRGTPNLAPAGRADWTARLRTAQRAWLVWRDAECALEPWETPNRFAHSIYSTLVAPCLEGETLARISDLRATYRSGGR